VRGAGLADQDVGGEEGGAGEGPGELGQERQGLGGEGQEDRRRARVEGLRAERGR